MLFSRKFYVSGRPDSNRRPSAWEATSRRRSPVASGSVLSQQDGRFSRQRGSRLFRLSRLVPLVVFGVCSTFLLGGSGSYADALTQRHPQAKPKNHDIWVAVGQCEQPGRGYRGINWSHRGDGGDGGYQGGLGFWHKSWDAFKPKGYPANAGDATWRQQMIVAQRLYDSVGWGWGCDPR